MTDDLQTCIERLEKLSEPNSNDERHIKYVRYINTFLSHFGNERVYLLGSTCEQLKLRSSKDEGDADFLLCSGKLEIPTANLEFRPDSPCFTWVKGDTLDQRSNLRLDLIDENFLPSNALRSIRPELFTIIRGIHHFVTRGSDYTPSYTRNTTTRIRSKVGLSTTEYYGLKLAEKDLSLIKTKHEAHELERKEVNNKPVVPFKENGDMDCVKNMFDVLVLLNTPKNKTGSHDGQFQHFIFVLKQYLKRQKEQEENTMPCVYGGPGNNGFEILYQREPAVVSVCQQDNKGESGHKVTSIPDEFKLNATVSDCQPQTLCKTQMMRKEITPRSEILVHATYVKKKSKDFVPALRITGKLQCMDEWKIRTHAWLSDKVVDEIYNMDVYIVSKCAPKDPDFDKDYCLSFNQAELKLSECMSAVQKKVLLIMKSYLKGKIANEHRIIKRELKLTTFHLKTTLYWAIETTDASLWMDANVIEIVRKVVRDLTKALRNKTLPHYFVPRSNLFAGFSDDDYRLLLDCMNQILDDSVGSIRLFLNMDDTIPADIDFTIEEISQVIEMSPDGGLRKEVDSIDNFMVDLQRGFNEKPMDTDGKVLINEAILAVISQMLEDEANSKLSAEIKKLPEEYGEFLSTLVPGFINILIKSKPGEELFSTLKKYLYCPRFNTEERSRLLMSLKEKIQMYFK